LIKKKTLTTNGVGHFKIQKIVPSEKYLKEDICCGVVPFVPVAATES